MFRMRRSRGEMYIGHGRLVCLSIATFPHYCTDLDVTWGNGRGCPLVAHHWADLQSVHGFRCYDNIVPNAKCQRLLVLALCLVCLLVMCNTAMQTHYKKSNSRRFIGRSDLDFSN